MQARSLVCVNCLSNWIVSRSVADTKISQHIQFVDIHINQADWRITYKAPVTLYRIVNITFEVGWSIATVQKQVSNKIGKTIVSDSNRI